MLRPFETNLIHFIPFGMQAVLNDLALEDMVANFNDAVRIRLPFNQTPQKFVLSQQVLCLQKMHSQNTLLMHNTNTPKDTNIDDVQGY